MILAYLCHFKHSVIFRLEFFLCRMMIYDWLRYVTQNTVTPLDNCKLRKLDFS